MGLWNKKPEDKKDDQSKSEVDSLVDALSARFEETLKPIREKVETVANWQAKIEEQFKEPPPDPNKKPDGTDLTPEEKRERAEQALLALNVTTNARITEENCIAGIRDQWPQVVAAVRADFAQTPWQRKSQKDYELYCQNVVDMHVGREAKKGGLRYNQKESKFFIEDASASTGGNDSPYNNPDLTWTDPRNPAKTLTASEQLAKLKIDPEAFAKWAKENGVLQ